MITKGIVEEIISPNEVRVRIPIFDRARDTSMSTKNSDLTVASICSLPNCYNFVQVGDVVFVGFEDNTTYRAIILGHLLTNNEHNTSEMRMNLNKLCVEGEARLSSETSIGQVTSTELGMLAGLTDNIQKQLDLLNTKIELIEKMLESEV